MSRIVPTVRRHHCDMRGLRVACGVVLLGLLIAAPTPSATSRPDDLAAVWAGVRPIGRDERFRPTAPPQVITRCSRTLGPRMAVHVELFAEDQVVLVPAGIGVGAPRGMVRGRLTEARCFGPLVTMDSTGTVLVRAGTRATAGDLFDAWAAPLSSVGFLDFSGGPVRAYVDGRRVTGDPRMVQLRGHAEIVLEVGPYVPPHRSYTFPSS